MRKFYFTLYEVTVLSLLGALTAVLQIVGKIPLGIPGHTGIYLVVPIIIGIAIVKKAGSGTYIGLIFGLISAFYGAGDNPSIVVFLRYFTIGVAADLASLPFKGHLDNAFVGIIVGSVANFAKLAEMYVVNSLLGIPMGFLLLGLGTASVFHLVFGGIGGLISALLLNRLYKAGIIPKGSDNAVQTSGGQ